MAGRRVVAPNAPAPFSGGNGSSRTFQIFAPLEDHRATFEWILSNAGRIQRGNGSEERLRNAFEIALRVHDGQKRKDGERDYVVHCLAALYYATVLLRGTAVSGAVALLHDAIEEARKRRLTLNYSYLTESVKDPVATDVAFLTTPLCAGPVIRDRDAPHCAVSSGSARNGTEYIWVPAYDQAYDLTHDYFRAAGSPYPPRAYAEMRKIYFGNLLRRIGAFVVKICEAIDNLSDIHNLPEESRARKLEEDRLLINIAARMDWILYDLMAHFLRQWGIDTPDLSKEIEAQQKNGIVVCRPRDQLDFRMASEELPIQHPSSPVVTVYMDAAQVFGQDILEIGLPRIGNGKMELLVRHCEGLGLEFSVGRSLLHGYFDLSARDSIYVVRGLSGETKRVTGSRINRFLERLANLQLELGGWAKEEMEY